MKTLSAGAVILTSLLSSQLPAQRGTMSRAGTGVQRPGNIPNPGGRLSGLSRAHHDQGQFSLPVSGYPWIYGDNAGDYGDGFQAQPPPSIIVVMPQVEQPPPPPPPPVRSEIREYHWPSSSGDSSGRAFSIVRKDHGVRSAIAVWVQGRFLCYAAPDGSRGRVPIDEVDREATRRINAEKQLNLPLPNGS
jgi:hypothetical protein